MNELTEKLFAWTEAEKMSHAAKLWAQYGTPSWAKYRDIRREAAGLKREYMRALRIASFRTSIL